MILFFHFCRSCSPAQDAISVYYNVQVPIVQVSSAVPEGKGVSSSASVEVASMSAIAAAHGNFSKLSMRKFFNFNSFLLLIFYFYLHKLEVLISLAEHIHIFIDSTKFQILEKGLFFSWLY